MPAKSKLRSLTARLTSLACAMGLEKFQQFNKKLRLLPRVHVIAVTDHDHARLRMEFLEDFDAGASRIIGANQRQRRRRDSCDLGVGQLQTWSPLDQNQSLRSRVCRPGVCPTARCRI